MYGPLKVLHRSHTGRLRPHEHTSYLPLAFILAITGVVLALFTFSANAATPYTGPEGGSIGLTGRVPAPAPSQAAVITSPADGSHFNTSPVTISGTCLKDNLVEVFKNDIFAGSTPCDSSGKFSLQIDPLFGKNIITARIYDALNQAGPISKPVTIYYDYTITGAAPISFLDLSGSQLLLDTDAAFRGSFPNQQLNVPVTVIGGTPPFAINVEWGDSTNKVVPAGTNSTFNTAHAYSRPGTYKITLQGTDSKNLVAFLSVAAIINGQPPAAATAATTATAKKVWALWPAFAVAVTALISFWIGERREKKILKAQATPVRGPFGRPAAPQPPAAPSATS